MEIVNIIKDHIEWRHQIFKLAKSDLKKTYSGSALGWAWAVIKPAITIFIYWFAFSVGLREDAGIGSHPFFLWLVSGIIAWFYMQEMWSSSPTSMKRYKFLITKMKFPTSTIPTFISLSKLVVHLCLVALVMIIFAIAGYGVSIYYIQLPVYMFLMFLLFTGWGLFSSVLGAMSNDFANLVKSFTLALFWLSGIMWPIDDITNIWAQRLLMINPVTFIVEGYRNCFIHQVWFYEEPTALLVFAIEIMVMWILAVKVYSKLRKEMPDVI